MLPRSQQVWSAFAPAARSSSPSPLSSSFDLTIREMYPRLLRRVKPWRSDVPARPRSACATSRFCLVAAVVLAAAGAALGFLRPGDYRHRAAALAPPRLAPLPNGHARYDERGHGISPPQPEKGVGAEANEQGCREVGAQHVLLTLALGGRRPQLLPYTSLSDGQRRHGHSVTEASPIPTQLGS